MPTPDFNPKLELEYWKSDVLSEGRTLIFDVLPEFLMRCIGVLRNKIFDEKTYQPALRSTDLARYKFYEGSPAEREVHVKNAIAYSQYIENMNKLVKPLFLEAEVLMEKLFLWIRFLVPRVLAGHNFNVNIQTAAGKNIQIIMAGIEQSIEMLNKYYLLRAQMLVYFIHRPYTTMEKESVSEMDGLGIESVWNELSILVHRIVCVREFIAKHIEHISAPRTEEEQLVY